MEALESGVDLINDHYGRSLTPGEEIPPKSQKLFSAGLWLAFRFFFFPVISNCMMEMKRLDPNLD